MGGRIVPFTSFKPVPNVGHIHVYLDGKLARMSSGLVGRVDVIPNVVSLSDSADLGKRIDRTDVGRAGRGNDEKWI